MNTKFNSDDLAYSKSYFHVKGKVCRNELNGEYALMPTKSDTSVPVCQDADISVIKRVVSMATKLVIEDESGYKSRKLTLAPSFLGRITKRSFRYFGLALVNCDGEVISASTVWCNNTVRTAAASLETFKSIILTRDFFKDHASAAVLSLKFVDRGILVADPVTGNLNHCNVFAIVNTL